MFQAQRLFTQSSPDPVGMLSKGVRPGQPVIRQRKWTSLGLAEYSQSADGQRSSLEVYGGASRDHRKDASVSPDGMAQERRNAILRI